MYQVYQIGPNETIDVIARKLGVSSEELRRLNGLVNGASVMSGSYIIIPSNNTMNMQKNKYIVKSGDNMYAIAKENNIDLDTLLKYNGLNKNDYIYPNQEILIPSSRTYITKENDTVKDVIDRLNIDIDKLGNLYLLQDQAITY